MIFIFTLHLTSKKLCISLHHAIEHNKKNSDKMNYSNSQIEAAKIDYNKFMSIHTLRNYDVDCIGINEATNRMFRHNDIVSSINAGNISLEKYWKMFFLMEIQKEEQKREEGKAKKQANKDASSDILAPIKEIKKLGEFSKWLNTPGNIFRKENFSKKYTIQSVNAFLSL